MRQRQFVVKVVLLMALVVGARQALPARQADPAQLALEAAKKTELVDRDLRGAIAQYRDAIARYGSNRALVANALIRLAGCLDELGDPDARMTWQRIVRDYPEQTAIVIEARTRLERSAPARGQIGLVPRRVLEPDWAGLLDISADGRMAAGRIRAGWSTYSVVVRDLQTGRTRTLATGQQYGGVRISDDARHVVFGGEGGLQIVNTATAAVEAIIPWPQDVFLAAPQDWSPDGKAILLVLYRDSATSGGRPSTQLAWLSVADKFIKPFWSFKPWQNPVGGGPLPASISRDGRFIAIAAEAREGSSDRFVYVIDAEGRRETTVVTIAGSPERPVWTPDGGALLFVAAGPGPAGLWAVTTKDGHSTSEPRRIYPELGGSLIGVTSSGILYYRKDIEGDGSGYGGNYVQMVRRGSESSGDPMTFPGWGPAWSADGQSVAVVRDDGSVVVRRMASGEERAYRPGNVVVSPMWLRDGSGLIVVTQNQPARATGVFHRVDIRTGAIQRLFDVGQRSATGAISPDDRTIYLGKAPSASGPFTGIVAVDLATGAERAVASLSAGLQLYQDPSIAMSPDGQMLAIRVFAKPDVDARILMLQTDGSGQRELVGTFASSWPGAVRWTKDGQSLLFVQSDANRNWRLMRVPAAGGTPVFDGLSYETLVPRVPKLRLSPGNFSGFDVSPDGSRIVLSTQTLTRSELWTLDNALSMISRP